MKTKIEKIKNEIEKHNRILIIFMFIACYLFGLSFLGSVGVNYDEKAEQNILKMNVLEYAQVFAKDSDLVAFYKEQGIVPIYQSVEKDHGISPYYLFTPLLALDKISEHTLSFAWHFYTYTLCFIGIVFCYLIVLELWNSKKVAAFSSLILFLTPRIFADGLYNNKDCVLLSLSIMCLYFGIRFIKNKSVRSALAFGTISAIACNVKVSGGFLFAMVGIFYLIELTKNKSWSKKTFGVGAIAVLSCILLYLILTPAIWAEGFHLFDFFKWSLQNSVSFARNYGYVWFENTLYEHWTNPLPWYYLPKIMFLTLPLFISILFILGLSFCIKNVIKKENKKENFFCLLCASIFLIPIFIALVSNPNIYNGWRHFYFLYGPMIILVSYAILIMFKNKKLSKMAYGFVIICLFGNLIGILKNGVSSSFYYNVVANNPSVNYEMDYYGVAATTVLQDLAKTEEDPVYLYAFESWALNYNYEALKNTYKEKIVLLKTKEELESALQEGVKPYYYYAHDYDKEENVAAYFVQDKELLKEYKTFNHTYATIYK